MNSLIRILIALTAAGGMVLTAGAAQTVKPYGKAYVQLDPCSIEAIAASMQRKPGDLSSEDARQLVTWCKTEQQKEQRARRHGMTLTNRPTSQLIWCGLNNCVCWKGPRYNGCVHTDKLCGTPLKCLGRVCGCTTK
ncbi:hypothetical protein [Thiolapillus sp.]